MGGNSPNSSCHVWNYKSVFLKLWITLACHGRNIFCTFVAETLYDFYKRSSPQCKILDFWLLRWKFTYLHFDRLLLLKVYKFQLKKVWRKYVSWYQTVVQNLKKNLFLCFKNEKNLVNSDPSTKKSKEFAFWLVNFLQSMQRLT